MRQDMGKPCLTPERLPPTGRNGSCSWAHQSGLRLNLYTLAQRRGGGGEDYYYISFEKKTISLSRPLSKGGDSGDGNSDKAHREGCSPKPSGAFGLSRVGVHLPHPLPPPCQEGRRGDAVDPGLRCMAEPAAPYPPLSPLPPLCLFLKTS